MSTKLRLTDFRLRTYHTFKILYTVYYGLRIIAVNFDQDADSSPRGTHVNCFVSFDSENFPAHITFDSIFDIGNSSPRSNVVQILTGHSDSFDFPFD